MFCYSKQVPTTSPESGNLIGNFSVVNFQGRSKVYPKKSGRNDQLLSEIQPIVVTWTCCESVTIY